MCENNLLLWYCILLLIALSSELRLNPTNDNNENDSLTVRYQLDTNITVNNENDLIQYNMRKNFNKDNNDTQYSYRLNFTSNLEDEDLMYLAHFEKNENDSQMAIESRLNSTEPDEVKNFMSQEIYENMNRIKDKNDSTSHNFPENFNEDNNKDNIELNNMCNNITCIRLCCPLGQRLVNGKCTILDTNLVMLPNMLIFIHNDTLSVEGKRLNELSLFVHDPCQKTGHYLIDGVKTRYTFLVNGFLYLLYYKAAIEPTSYCLAVVDQNKFVVNACFDTMQKIINTTRYPAGTWGLIQVNALSIVVVLTHVGGMLISLIMFMAYSMPELRNIQSFILRGYSSLIFIGHTVQLVTFIARKEALGFFICTACAYIQYYCFVGYFFWLNILNFDMWCAFRKIRSLQGNTKRQERKKLIRYFLYAIGGPLVLSIICAIVDIAPNLPENLIRPGFIIWHDITTCWFSDIRANLLYVQGVRVISVIISVILSICTSRKISHYQKDVVHQLKDLESRRFNDNRRWFKLTVKITILLFIIICVRSYMYIVYAAYNESTHVAAFTILAMEVIQNACIFIIFVCKKKIMQLMLKRFDCWKHDGTSRRTKTETID